MTQKPDPLFVIARDGWAMIAVRAGAPGAKKLRVAALIDCEGVQDEDTPFPPPEASAAAASAALQALREPSLRERPFILVAPPAWRDLFQRLAPPAVAFWLVAAYAPPEGEFEGIEAVRHPAPADIWTPAFH